MQILGTRQDLESRHIHVNFQECNDENISFFFFFESSTSTFLVNENINKSIITCMACERVNMYTACKWSIFKKLKKQLNNIFVHINMICGCSTLMEKTTAEATEDSGGKVQMNIWPAQPKDLSRFNIFSYSLTKIRLRNFMNEILAALSHRRSLKFRAYIHSNFAVKSFSKHFCKLHSNYKQLQQSDMSMSSIT